jgi:hypothetical protein
MKKLSELFHHFSHAVVPKTEEEDPHQQLIARIEKDEDLLRLIRFTAWEVGVALANKSEHPGQAKKQLAIQDPYKNWRQLSPQFLTAVTKLHDSGFELTDDNVFPFIERITQAADSATPIFPSLTE